MKLHDFETRLAMLIAERNLTPYAWGTNDCATWAADAALAVSGEDLLGDLRGTWHDEPSAMAAIEAQGGLIAYMDRLKPRRSVVQLAQRGDIAFVRLDDGTPSLAVVEVAQVVAPGDDGLLFMPLEYARIVWEV